MGLALDDAARGILAIADKQITGAIRVVSVAGEVAPPSGS
jgi:hypothetical protein